jgi:hypothetical protein
MAIAVKEVLMPQTKPDPASWSQGVPPRAIVRYSRTGKRTALATVSWMTAATTGDPVILSFIFFMILFLGGIYLMGLAQSLEDFQAIVFCGGLLLTSLSLAFMMRQGGTATKRSNNWAGKATD